MMLKSYVKRVNFKKSTGTLDLGVNSGGYFLSNNEGIIHVSLSNAERFIDQDRKTLLEEAQCPR